MGNKGDVSDFERGVFVCIRQAGLGANQTAKST